MCVPPTWVSKLFCSHRKRQNTKKMAMVAAVWIIFLLCDVFGQNHDYLTENEIYKWWDNGNAEVKDFKIFTGSHREKLNVLTTDLRSAHADGHGASFTSYNYSENTNMTLTIDNIPKIGAGYLSIVATFSNRINLINGEPIHVILNNNNNKKNEYMLFKFETSSNIYDKLLVITLTPFQGKPIAFISNSTIPTITSYQNKIYSHINIEIDNNMDNTTNITYYILTKTETLSSRFYLTVSTYFTNILLQSGVPRLENVNYGFNRFYYFNVTKINCTLGIVLSVIEGDPDLFISFSVNNKYPTSKNGFNLSSTNFGSDYIMIKNAKIQMYFIGVEPKLNKNVKYTINTILKCINDKNKYFEYLIDGISTMNILSSKEWSFFKFEFNFNHSLISKILIQINPSYGDPDLYLDIDKEINITTNPKLWKFNSTQFGSDHIRLLYNDYFNICNKDKSDTFCSLDIAVFGYSSTIYTIMVSTDESHIILSNGKPLIGHISTINNKQLYQYYMFDVENINSILINNNITISITPLVSTSDSLINTQFFVDSDNNQYPNNINNGYKYKSTNDKSHPFLIINGNDIINNKFNELYIGVTSNKNISFIIILTIGSKIQLQNGQLQYGHINSINQPIYYQLILNDIDDNNNNENIEITVSSLHGTIAMYIGSKFVPNPQNSTTYNLYNIQKNISIKRIIINQTKFKEKLCINNLCRYYITISSIDKNEQEAEFTIIASTNYAVIPLSDGQPISSQISSNSYEYFSINIDYSYKLKPALFIELTPIKGNVNLYVSDNDNNHRPNISHYNYKSEKTGYDTDSIIIEIAKETTYYISVYSCSQSQSIFTITSTLSNSLYPGFIRLFSGIPQSGSIKTSIYGHHSKSRFYQIYVPTDATLLKFHINHVGFSINCYITHNITKSLPSLNNQLYNIKGGTLIISNPLQGSYFIGIYSRILSFFTITATLSNDILILQDGQSINGEIKAKKYDYYQIEIDDLEKDFTISLTSFSGDPDLYISLNNNFGSIRPTKSNYTWYSNHYGSDLITISHHDPKRKCNISINLIQCIYIIAIYGYRNSIYSITVTTEITIELQNGIPIQGKLIKYQWHYYKFKVLNNHPLMLIVGITEISGSNDLFIDINKEPTETSYLYSSYSWNQDKNIQINHIKCPSIHDDQNVEFCNYFIGIRAITDSKYSVFIQSTSSETEFLIEDNIPITRSINADQFLFFRYQISENLKDLTISFTPITGKPKCYISSIIERPNEHNHEYEIINGAQSIFIINNIYNDTIYYMTVFSLSFDSTFTLSVTATHYNRSMDATGIQLIEGQIQFGSININRKNYWSYYSFTPTISLQTDIIISVYALSGDPDIYCNINSYPTLNRYLYIADLDGPETLNIPHINNTYYCGIYADNNASTQFYIIGYHSHSIITLLDDIPIIGQLNTKNNVNYYHFIAQSLIDDIISIIFTPIYSSSKYNIYISYQYPYPNKTHHQYSMNNSINNGLNGLDLKLKKSDLLISKDWYISITPCNNNNNNTYNTLYTLLLTYDNVTTLQQGLPQNGQITSLKESYYIWNINLSEKEKNGILSIAVSLLSGNCTIYLSRNPLLINSCNNNDIIGQCPIELFDVKQSCSDLTPLIIKPSDNYYIDNKKGTYYISILTNSDHDISYYNIIVYTSYTILYLTNAIPTWDSIQLNQYKYYSLLCDKEKIIGLDVVITIRNNNNNNNNNNKSPFILKGIISTMRERPNQPLQDNEFETKWINDGAVFSISINDETFIKSSQYFISLYSVKNPNYNGNDDDDDDDNDNDNDIDMIYTISGVASIDNSIEYRVLLNDVEQMSIIHNIDYKRYYLFRPSSVENIKSIKFTLEIAQGKVSMYIISDINNHQQIPSSKNYKYKLENINIHKTLIINNKNDICNNNCAYLIVIDAEQESIYSIRATSYYYNINDNNNNKNKNKFNKILFYIIGFIVCIIIIILVVIGFNNYRKNKRLNYELDVAELQLNMNGKKSLRQRREELQSTTNVPAKPWKMKKNKKKYSGLDDDDDDNDDDHDDYDDDHDVDFNMNDNIMIH